MATNLTLLFSTLITANHILDFYSVLDAYGHISVRNPSNSNTFFMSRSLAPALVSSTADIIEYRISDASPLETNAPSGFIERYIHSETYKRYANVEVVLHSHTEEILPFSVTEVPLLAIAQSGSVLADTLTPVPIFDSADFVAENESQALLVGNTRLGSALASHFSNLSSSFNESDLPPANVVLMRGHGMAVIGTSIQDTVFRAINTISNARTQRFALQLSSLCDVSGQVGACGQGTVKLLSDEEIRDSRAAGPIYQGRAWELWVRRVEAEARNAIYKNDLGRFLS